MPTENNARTVFALSSIISRKTDTREVTNAIDTRPTVLTGLGFTIVNSYTHHIQNQITAKDYPQGRPLYFQFNG